MVAVPGEDGGGGISSVVEGNGFAVDGRSSGEGSGRQSASLSGIAFLESLSAVRHLLLMLVDVYLSWDKMVFLSPPGLPRWFLSQWPGGDGLKI